MGIQGPSPTATHRGAPCARGKWSPCARGIQGPDARARAHGVPWAQYKPVRTGCSSINSLGSPWARGLGGPCARGHLGLPVLLVLHSVLVRVALGWLLFSLGVLLSLLVVRT